MSRKMKDSGIEWIGEIPEDWNMKRVKHSFRRKNEKAMQEDPIVLSLARSGVKIRDVSNNEGQVAESYYNYNPVEVDDILINPMDLYSGDNCNISKVTGVISPAYINLKNNDYVNPNFYNYYFKTQYWLMAFFAHGKGVSFENRWTLNTETLMNYPIVNPSYIEQKRISNYLDTRCTLIDQTIEKQKQIIEKLKKYKQSVITEAVTKGLDPNVPMKDSGIEWIGEIPKHWLLTKIKYSCIFNPKLEEQIEDDQDISFAPMECVKSGYMLSNSIKYVNVKSGYTYFAANDIIMAKVTPCFENGNIAVAKDLINKIGFGSSELFVFRPKNIDRDFMFFYLRNYFFMKECEGTMYGTGGLKRVSPDFVKNVRLGVPSIQEQKQIADYLLKIENQINSAIDIKQRGIEKLESYKKSLIYECVTGKREVK